MNQNAAAIILLVYCKQQLLWVDGPFQLKPTVALELLESNLVELRQPNSPAVRGSVGTGRPLLHRRRLLNQTLHQLLVTLILAVVVVGRKLVGPLQGSLRAQLHLVKLLQPHSAHVDLSKFRLLGQLIAFSVLLLLFVLLKRQSPFQLQLRAPAEAQLSVALRLLALIVDLHPIHLQTKHSLDLL